MSEKNDFVYNGIKFVVDYHINPVQRYKADFDQDFKTFDEFVAERPPQRFSKILHENYHNAKTYYLFDCLENEIGLMPPKPAKQESLARLPVPEFIKEIRKLHKYQLSKSVKKIKPTQTMLDLCQKPALIEQVAKMLDVKEK